MSSSTENTESFNIEDLEIYNPSDDLKDPEDQAELLKDAIESEDPKYFVHALRTVAKAQGLTVTDEDALEDLVKNHNQPIALCLKIFNTIGIDVSIKKDKKDGGDS